MNKFPYEDIFKSIESRLIEVGSRNMERIEILRKLDSFKFENRELTDNEYFEILVLVVFYSGFRAATVTSKKQVIKKHFPNWEAVSNYNNSEIEKIIEDPEMISHKKKIYACVGNAKKFALLIKKHGSINGYIKSYSPQDSPENLIALKNSLQNSFSYLGKITAYHFMTDIGLPVIKPDRVICRILERLGLLKSQNKLQEAVIQGKKFADACNLPIRYIDIIFVYYGQVKSTEIGIEKGICLEKPQCRECSIKNHCNFITI